MPLRFKLKTLLLAAGLFSLAFHSGCTQRVGVSDISTRLNSITSNENPCDLPNNWTNTVFRNIVSAKLLVVPGLIEAIDDTTMTKVEICHFEENYLVSDLSIICLGSIVNELPLENINRLTDEWQYIGLWNYLRQNEKERTILKRRIAHWYEKIKGDLIWVENPASRFGGHYEVKK